MPFIRFICSFSGFTVADGFGVLPKCSLCTAIHAGSGALDGTRYSGLAKNTGLRAE